MPRKNRPYKKGKPHRDARLFVIVAEGEREDKYFQYFNEKNLRIQVKIIPRKENQSAPNHFLSRIEKYIDEGGWSPKDNDILWCVLDVDKWPRTEIENIYAACQQNTNWNIGISNPCFEVWLLFHTMEKITDNGETPNQLKRLLHEQMSGGYKVENFAPLIETACQNSTEADENPHGYFPDRMQTKLYGLGNEIVKKLGGNWNI